MKPIENNKESSSPSHGLVRSVFEDACERVGWQGPLTVLQATATSEGQAKRAEPRGPSRPQGLQTILGQTWLSGGRRKKAKAAGRGGLLSHSHTFSLFTFFFSFFPLLFLPSFSSPSLHQPATAMSKTASPRPTKDAKSKRPAKKAAAPVWSGVVKSFHLESYFKDDKGTVIIINIIFSSPP